MVSEFMANSSWRKDRVIRDEVKREAGTKDMLELR